MPAPPDRHHAPPRRADVGCRSGPIDRLLASAGEIAPQLTITETGHPSGNRRLALVGEFDIAVAERLVERIRCLGHAGGTIRLDLSELDFIDVCGLRAIISCAAYADDNGFELVVERQVSRNVRRLIDVVGAGARLWPHTPDGRRTALRAHAPVGGCEPKVRPLTV